MFNKLFFLKSFLIILFVSVVLATPKLSFASTFSLSPASSNVGLGSTIGVRVTLNTGGVPVNGVTGVLTYPADKLDVTSISYSGSFDIAAPQSYGGGSINFSRGSVNGVTGGVTVATINFRGKSLGQANISFSGGSHVARADNNSESLDLGGSRGASLTVIAATPKPAADLAGVKINDLKITDIATNSATLTWTTIKPSNSTVDYGLDKDNYFLTFGKQESVTIHTIQIQKIVLQPGTQVHLRVKSKDVAGNESQSDDQIIQLLGYKLHVHLVDASSSPLKNTPIVIYSDPIQKQTDDNGDVEFDNLASGKHVLVAKTTGGDRSAEIGVEDNHDFTKVQNLSVKIDNSAKNQVDFGKRYTILGVDLGYLAGIVSVLILIVAIILFVLIKKRSDNAKSNSEIGDPSGPVSGPSK